MEKEVKLYCIFLKYRYLKKVYIGRYIKIDRYIKKDRQIYKERQIDRQILDRQ